MYITLVLYNIDNNIIPDVVSDYLLSLNIFHNVIGLSELKNEINKKDNYFLIAIIGIKGFDIFDYNSKLYIELHNFINYNNIGVLNFEQVTEKNRMNYIATIIKKFNNLKIFDYSYENILFIKEYLKHYNIKYENEIIHLPYQFNLKENLILKKNDEYLYDIGIINAEIKKHESNKDDIIYLRSEIYHKLLDDKKYKIKNIMGWGEERDNMINKCKIILNVHHFQFFEIHESIRCDRLVFAKKIIVSDYSKYYDKLDTCNNIFYEKYENLITLCYKILENFDGYNKIVQNLDVLSIINKRKEAIQNIKFD